MYESKHETVKTTRIPKKIVLEKVNEILKPIEMQHMTRPYGTFGIKR